MLAVDAVIGHQLGFLLLERVRALVNAWGLVGRLAAPRHGESSLGAERRDA
jgi:hypothetical protein